MEDCCGNQVFLAARLLRRSGQNRSNLHAGAVWCRSATVCLRISMKGTEQSVTGRIGALARASSACAQRALAGRTKQAGVIPLDRTSGSESVVPLVRGQRALDLRGKRRRLSPVWQPTIRRKSVQTCTRCLIWGQCGLCDRQCRCERAAALNLSVRPNRVPTRRTTYPGAPRLVLGSQRTPLRRHSALPSILSRPAPRR